MSQPILYRAGTSSSPGFDNFSKKDIQVGADGNVHPNTGGISTFSQKDSVWSEKATWVLQKDVLHDSGLQARNDYGGHWLIEPSMPMSLNTYKSHLEQLNSRARLYDPHSKPSASEPQARVLKADSTHSDKATRFVYMALASVVHHRIPIEGWGDNDYSYAAELAHALEDNTLPLDGLLWDEQGGWCKEKVYAAIAVSASIGYEAARAEESGDEDQQADALNDESFLCNVLKFDDARNPFLSYVQYLSQEAS